MEWLDRLHEFVRELDALLSDRHEESMNWWNELGDTIIRLIRLWEMHEK
jgi:hypothetical protein